MPRRTVAFRAKRTSAFAASGVMWFAPPAFAQQAVDGPIPEAAIPEIVVTGRPLPDPIGYGVYGVAEIDRARLQSTASGRLEDALRDVAGLTQFRRSDARSANATSQGATLRGLGGNASTRALVVLDGVPQTDPFGGWITWPAYAPNRLAGARVTRGGGVGALGPGALSGVIELDSVSATDAPSQAASFAYGARDSLDASALLSGDIGDAFAFVGGSYVRGDGFTPIVEDDRGAVDGPAPYEQASVSARVVAPIGGETEAQLAFLAFADNRNRGVPFTDNSGRGFDLSLRLVNDPVARDAWAWSALAYGQVRRFENNFAAVDADRASARLVLDQFDVPSTAIGGRFEARPPVGDDIDLRIGGDARFATGETNERFFFIDGVPQNQRRAGGDALTGGLYFEGGLERGPWTITGGARVDYWRLTDGAIEQFVVATGETSAQTIFPSRDGVEPTGRLAAAYEISPAVSVRAAGYIGWRLPTLNELYRPFRVGSIVTGANADLDTERLRGVEAGFDLTPTENVSFRITGFENRLGGAIANVTLAPGPGFFAGIGFVPDGGFARQRQNLDAVRARGLEVDGDLRFGGNGDWRASASYAFTSARVEAGGDAAALDGLRPAQIPTHTASATLAWRTLSSTLRYTSARFEDDLNLRSLDDAFTIDAAAAWPIGGGFSVVFRGENLSDATVETALSAAGVVERALPRTLWIGLNFEN